MLTKEQNELLCRVGPGTPVGEMMRQYWVPALLSSEVPEQDGAPVRVRLLGEDLIAFRDTSGTAGLLQNACPHRGASMFFGRNEADGLRCVYHGWKFDVSGACVDMPNEPAESNFKHKIRATAYRCLERAGIVWAWMGAGDHVPPLPDFEFNLLPESHVRVGRRYHETNYLQALEGGIDTSHASFLHSSLQPRQPGETIASTLLAPERRPGLEVVEMEGGLIIGARRDQGAGTEYWRLNLFQLPFYTQTPSAGRHSLIAWVPMDDDHTLRVAVVWDPAEPITDERLAEETRRTGRNPLPGGFISQDRLRPATSQPAGAWRAVADHTNDYLIDREFQRTKRFSGVDGGDVGTEDLSVTESMGAICDRTKEHLGTTDMGIIATRRMISRAALAWRDQRVAPPGAERPEVFCVRAPAYVTQKGTDWLAQGREFMKGRPGVPDATLQMPAGRTR